MIHHFITEPHHVKLVGNILNTQLFSTFSKEYPLVILTDPYVHSYLLPPILETLYSLDYRVIVLSLPSGEQSKTWEFFISLQNCLIDNKITIGSSILAIGGGVVLDMAGFIASTYCRGIPLFLIPTTLTAMIDAAIGGKNGINLRGFKNRLGTIYYPKDVWIYPEFLRSLPKQEWSNGIAEAIKHGCIANPYLWKFLHNHHETLFTSSEILKELIKRNCAIKAAIVARDPNDRGLRRILNFGHTFAHAIETLSQGYVPHGQAVSVGMMLEMKIALHSGITQDATLIDRLHSLLSAFHLPTTLQELQELIPEHLHQEFYHVEKIIQTLGYDKKNLSEKNMRIVMIEQLGKAAPFNGAYCTTPNMEILHSILREACHALCYS